MVFYSLKKKSVKLSTDIVFDSIPIALAKSKIELEGWGEFNFISTSTQFTE